MVLPDEIVWLKAVKGEHRLKPWLVGTVNKGSCIVPSLTSTVSHYQTYSTGMSCYVLAYIMWFTETFSPKITVSSLRSCYCVKLVNVCILPRVNAGNILRNLLIIASEKDDFLTVKKFNMNLKEQYWALHKKEGGDRTFWLKALVICLQSSLILCWVNQRSFGPLKREMFIYRHLYHYSLRNYISEMKRTMK